MLLDKDGNTLVFDDYFTLKKHDQILSSDPLTFNLESKKAIEETLTIQYRTLIVLDDIIGNKVSNDVTFEGEEVTEGEREDSFPITHTLSRVVVVDKVKLVVYTYKSR